MRKNRYPIDRTAFDIFPEELRYKINKDKPLLKPYFQFEDSKRIFLETLNLLKADTEKGAYTIIKPKPGDFKTDKQLEEGGNDFIPIPGGYTVSDYRKGELNFDFFGIQLCPIFHNEILFNIAYKFYEDNFDKLQFNYEKDS